MRSTLTAGIWALVLAGQSVAADLPNASFTMPAKNGARWTLTFDGKEKYTVARDGKEVAQGTYKIDGDQIEVRDTVGTERVKGVGLYRFKLEGKALTFTKVSDLATGRVEMITQGPWTRKE